jgi:hypothetical protein
VYTVRATEPQVSELTGITDETLRYFDEHHILRVEPLHGWMRNSDFHPPLQPGDCTRSRGVAGQIRRVSADGVVSVHALRDQSDVPGMRAADEAADGD